MIDNGLAYAILLFVVFGWNCIFLMLICLWAWKGNFKSSYNYRPWKPFPVPEDVATKIDKEGAKWLFFIAGAFLCAMIAGFVYGFATGDFNNLPNIFLVIAAAWVAIMFAFVIGGYIYAWLVVNKHNAGKT